MQYVFYQLVMSLSLMTVVHTQAPTGIRTWVASMSGKWQTNGPIHPNQLFSVVTTLSSWFTKIKCIKAFNIKGFLF